MNTLQEKQKTLKALWEPRSIAVVGASRRPETVGYAVLSNLVNGGFKGSIFPVNPKADTIAGLKCYPALENVPGPVDLAVIIVPAGGVADVLRTCAVKGAGAAVVISAGFREVGPEGARLEKEILALARQAGLALLGPNCLGHINTDPEVMLNASFSRTMPRAGNIAFVSQSGALCAAILDYAKGKNIGFSKFVSLGNKADIHELDMLRYLKDDPETDVILMYLEDLVNGRAFIEMAREITGEMAPSKPILVIKSGRTPQGAQAASSHTGSLMGSDEVYDAIFSQAGVLRVDSVEEMFHFAVGFANQPVPRGKSVAIVTNAGGPGIMATDACVRYGLEMAKFSSVTTAKLRAALPATASVANPIDVIGDARHGRYEAALAAAFEDPAVDSVLVILTPQAMTDIEEIARVIVEADQKYDKPVFAAFMGIVDVSAGARILEEHHVPLYTFPEEAARTLGAMARYKDWTDRPRTEVKNFPADKEKTREILGSALQSRRYFLTPDQSMEVFKAYGFLVLPFGLAGSEAEAAAHALRIGYPVALKIVSPEIIHKFDVGGVSLGIADEEALRAAYRKMMRSIAGQSGHYRIDGIFVQAMAARGWEVILGMKRDPHFGPILMFGLGGIYVEALKDVTFRLAPVREFGARRMIESIKAYALLKGVRGQKPSDITAILEALERLSQLACDFPAISEIDINPLMVYGESQGAALADARIILNPTEER